MNFFEINHATCNQDGICAAICPARLIEIPKDGYPTAVPEADDVCIRCGHCVAVCPTGSFSHRDIPLDQCPPVQKELLLNTDQCIQFLRNRRSIRTYKNKPVHQDILTKLIETARYAPSGHNAQCVEWLVLGNKDELYRLSGTVVNFLRWMIDNMADFAKLMHMDRTVNGWEEGIDVILRGAPVVIVAHAEKENPLAPAACTIALTYLELAATSMGLGCCWAGYFNAAANSFPPMVEALPIPKEHQSFGAMMVGYPKFNYHRLPARKTPKINWRL